METAAVVFSIVIILSLLPAEGVRLNKLFNMLDGFRSEHDLRGFLHVGEQYAVYLRAPRPHDRLLTYELYESNNVPSGRYTPKLIAVSEVPVEYVREQLRIFLDELDLAKNVDENVVPGARVRTLREWQLERQFGGVKEQELGVLLNNKPRISRISA